jgi:hypothetical protein
VTGSTRRQYFVVSVPGGAVAGVVWAVAADTDEAIMLKATTNVLGAMSFLLEWRGWHAPPSPNMKGRFDRRVIRSAGNYVLS